MKAKRILLVLATTLLLPAALFAAEIRGIVAGIDLTKHELVLDNVKPKKADHVFVVNDKTQVLYGKEPGSLKDIPLGRNVRVEVVERDGQLVVTAIHVLGRAPAANVVADGSTVSGTLRRVALTDREIVVIGPGAKGPETETTISVPSATRILRDNKAVEFAELKEGESVAVAVEKRDGHWVAKSIQSGTGTPAAAAAKESNFAPRLRLFLRIADGILQQMEPKKDR
jgi:Cu/Ag efflux protein CusF